SGPRVWGAGGHLASRTRGPAASARTPASRRVAVGPHARSGRVLQLAVAPPPRTVESRRSVASPNARPRPRPPSRTLLGSAAPHRVGQARSWAAWDRQEWAGGRAALHLADG